MKRLTPYQKQMLLRAFKYAPFRQMLISVFWDVFAPSKRNKLIRCIEYGMNWDAAFEAAKVTEGGNNG